MWGSVDAAALLREDFRFADRTDKVAEREAKAVDFWCNSELSHRERLAKLRQRAGSPVPAGWSAFDEARQVLLTEAEEADIARLAGEMGEEDVQQLLDAAQYCKMERSNTFLDVVEEFWFLHEERKKAEKAGQPGPQKSARSEAEKLAACAEMFTPDHTDPLYDGPGKLILDTQEGAFECLCRHCESEGAEVVFFTRDHMGFATREWPNFRDANFGNIRPRVDLGMSLVRTETVCARCDGHLGHLFMENPEKDGADDQYKEDAARTHHSFCSNASSLVFKQGGKKTMMMDLLQGLGVKPWEN